MVLDCEGKGSSARVQVHFESAGSKWLVLAYAHSRCYRLINLYVKRTFKLTSVEYGTKKIFTICRCRCSSLALTGCGDKGEVTESKTSTSKLQIRIKLWEWKMVTTWPKNFPGLGTGAEFLAKQINAMSNGRINVKVYGAGELVPAFEIFDAVANGSAQMGHGSAYYWKGKYSALQFFSTTPFGMTAMEMNAWLYHGGGMELWQEAYKQFGLVPAAAGNTNVQMAGWFNKEINTLEDLKGLKMRIPGLGGEVLKRAGGTPVNLTWW